jgi:PAS domain S-box-containing protein
MSDLLRVLILEDSAVDAELMTRELLGEGLSFTATRVWTESDFTAEVRTRTPDIILADYSLPAYDGMSALRVAAQEHPEIPFIFVSGTLGEETAIDALHNGATDYVLKYRLTRLGPAVRRALLAVDDRRRRDDAERALRESEERFKSIFDHVTDGILLVDPDTGVFTTANQTMCAMLGCTGDELMRLGVQDIHAAADLPAIDAAFRQERPGESVVIHDLSVTRKDGTLFFSDVNSAPVTILGRRLIMMNVRDVTERRALQAGVAQADRLASMGMLAAGVAHEINNPLAYVLYNLENLAEELPKLADVVEGRDELVRAATEALGGTHRIKDIARGLSTFSRIDKGACARVDLGYVIECAASMAQNEIKYRARLIKKLDRVPAVWASEGGLCQVFLNLLINAAHAIGEGYPHRNSITVRTFEADGNVVAEVADTGSGIPPESLERVFDPFFTTKAAGTGSGLGLAISRNIVRGFGGEITVDSQPGAGARFIVRLPVSAIEPAERRHAVESEAPRIPAVRGRILILDDEEAVRHMLERMLCLQHEVVTAASGLEGQALLAKDRAFDLIVCDLMMPDMTGMDLHAWLVTRDPALAGQVVFLTGGAFTPRAAEYLASVPNLRFEKPVDREGLLQVVAERILEYRRNRPADLEAAP